MSWPIQITEEGRVPIPEELQERFGIEAGGEVVWVPTDDGILLRNTEGSARGALVPDDTPPEKREEVARELERRIEEIRK